MRRTELRDKLKDALAQAKVMPLLVTAPDREDWVYIISADLFNSLLKQLTQSKETLEILATPLGRRLMQIDPVKMEEDLRTGQLHSFEEAFGDDD